MMMWTYKCSGDAILKRWGCFGAIQKERGNTKMKMRERQVIPISATVTLGVPMNAPIEDAIVLQERVVRFVIEAEGMSVVQEDQTDRGSRSRRDRWEWSSISI